MYVCMFYVCMYVYTYVCMYVCMYVYTYVYTSFSIRSSGEAIVTDTTINLALVCILMHVGNSTGVHFTLSGNPKP